MHQSHAHRRHRRDGESGAALVEFALVLPILLLLLLGMLDFGKAFNYWIDQTHLAHEGARWAVVNKNPGPGPTLQDSMRLKANTTELLNGGTASVPNPVQVCIGFPSGSSNVGDPVQVTVSVDYNWIPFIGNAIGMGTSTLSASSTMRLEAVPTNYGAGCA